MTLKEFVKKYKDYEAQGFTIEAIIGQAIYENDIDFEPISQSYIHGVKRKLQRYRNDISMYDRILHYRRNNLPGIEFFEKEEQELINKYGLK